MQHQQTQEEEKDDEQEKQPLSSSSSSSSSTLMAFGAGCYWGTEKYIVKEFQKRYPKTIHNAKVGFMSPNNNKNDKITNPPSYKQVCTGKTSYIEVLNVELVVVNKKNNTNTNTNKKYLSMKQLIEEVCKFFFMFHDPTTQNRQGNDIGIQYSSIIFCSTDEQYNIAMNIKKELQTLIDTSSKMKNKYERSYIHTQICYYTTFYQAHKEHQQYLSKNPFGYCNHRYRFKHWPTTTTTTTTTTNTTNDDDDNNDNNNNNNMRFISLLLKLIPFRKNNN